MFAHRGDAHDRDAQVEIDHQAANDGELLVVLLAEHGEVGFDCRQQLRDHRRHALEVAGAALPLHRRRERTGDDAGVEPNRVHRRRRRRVHEVDARRPACREVVVDRGRVVREIGCLAELQRVDENRHDDGVRE